MCKRCVFLALCIQLALSIIVSTKVFAQGAASSGGNQQNKYQSFIRYAKSKRGLITVHEIYEQQPKMTKKIYFEIPRSLFGRDLLLSSKVSSTSDPSVVAAGEMQFDPKLVYFSKEGGEIRLRQVLNNNVVNHSQTLAKAYYRNNLDPILESFTIKLSNPQDSSLLIDVTNYLKSASGDMGISPKYARQRGRGARFSPRRELISIVNTQAFTNNVNVSCALSYDNEGVPFSSVVTRSMVLLPHKPMKPRLYDSRLNHFSTDKYRYDINNAEVEKVAYIHRWDIQPKPEDVDRYKAGELVEPAKPIVFYVDNALPDNWRKYVKQGIEDWQAAFEAIGFKNAIIAKDFPDDPAFNPDDIRYSCVRYIPSPVTNAKGPSWVDPRSGEIIQGSVYLYHNILKKVHDWRFVQTAAADRRVRQRVFDDELIGESLRNVVTHEIGHTLGLTHNMGASSGYPVDSLRSATFTKEYGISPSVMDYVRYNYVAQPEDKEVQLLSHGVGISDKFSIKVAYHPLFEVSNSQDESVAINDWITEKSDDTMFFYGPQMNFPIDPNAQAESLGDDPILAAKLGIKNIQTTMQYLLEWTAEPGESYQYTREMYRELVQQYNTYLGHATAFIGGAYLFASVHGQNNSACIPVTKEKQKEVLHFLFNELVEQPNWIIDSDIINKIGLSNNMLLKSQGKMVYGLMSDDFISRIELIDSNTDTGYSISDYMNDLFGFVWHPTQNNQELDKYQRNLQQVYVAGLLSHYKSSDSKKDKQQSRGYYSYADEQDVSISFMDFVNQRGMFNSNKTFVSNETKMVCLNQLKRLEKMLQAKAKKGNAVTVQHYQYLLDSIKNVLL